MSTRSPKIARLRNKEYREAFVASQINIGLPFQIRALREQRGWKQSQLAAETGMLQPRISAMESAGSVKFNLETLRRLAAAFDVALVVRFAPFSELVSWSDAFSPDTFRVSAFNDDVFETGAVTVSQASKIMDQLRQPSTVKWHLVPTSHMFKVGVGFGQTAEVARGTVGGKLEAVNQIGGSSFGVTHVFDELQSMVGPRSRNQYLYPLQRGVDYHV